jgi:replication factor C subunit 3/5
MALLRELFGGSVEKLKLENKTVKIPNRTTTIELTTLSSAHHIELNPSDAGNNDRFVVQEVIKEIASNQPLDVMVPSNRAFKVVILNEVDRLSKPAQHGLR